MYLCQESMLIAKRKQNLLFVASRLYFNYCCSMRSFDNYKITLNKIKKKTKKRSYGKFFFYYIDFKNRFSTVFI